MNKEKLKNYLKEQEEKIKIKERNLLNSGYDRDDSETYYRGFYNGEIITIIALYNLIEIGVFNDEND